VTGLGVAESDVPAEILVISEKIFETLSFSAERQLQEATTSGKSELVLTD
jgi:hypothetical protein